MNILEEINEIKEYFANLKAEAIAQSELEVIDNIITVINENNQEETHKNIGTKINKFNYKKYINCKNALDEILQSIENIKINGIENLLFQAKIERLHEVEKQVMHKISTFEKGNKV